MASSTLSLEPRSLNLSVRDASFILAVLIACVFANGLTTPYMFDDVYWIRDNPAIRTLWPPSSTRRPLGYYSLQLDYAIHGNRVFGYHAANIGIHAAAAVVLFLLIRGTIASKEIAAVCPLVLLLYDRAFLAGTFRGALKQRWGLYLAMLPPLVWLAMTMRGTLGDDGTNAGFGYEGVTPWEYLRSQGGVILHYLRLSFWPDSLCLDYGWPVASSPLAIYLPCGIILALVLASLWGTWKFPKLGFLGLSFFLILAPTSSF